jgi:endonuclease/exonuclease/phosphatase (EEP) superfamily protein YafD
LRRASTSAIGDFMRKITCLFLSSLSTFLCLNCSAKYVIPEDDKVIQKFGNYDTTLKNLDPQSIKVLVWNMYKGQNPSWREDFLSLSQNKDVLLLQEIYTTDLMLDTFAESDFGFEMATSFLNSKEGYLATGVGNASKVKPLSIFYQRSPDLEPFIKTPKMVSFTEFALEGEKEKVIFISIHAINFVSARKLERQLMQVEQFLRTWKGPVVFAGDFNTWSKKKIGVMRGMARRLGLSEVQFDPNEDDRMETFGNKLDYIFTKGLRHLNSKVHGSILGSDHKALEVELAIE